MGRRVGCPSGRKKIPGQIEVDAVKLIQGRNLGVGAPPPSAFYTLAKRMSLNKGATHFTLGLRPRNISFFIL